MLNSEAQLDDQDYEANREGEEKNSVKNHGGLILDLALKSEAHGDDQGYDANAVGEDWIEIHGRLTIVS